MKKNLLKTLCALLALLLAAAPALAAQQPPLDTLIALAGDHTTTPGDVAITQLEIKGLDAPQVGHLLQTSVLAKANDGIMWALPVIWADLDGNIITEAKAGDTCLPFIAFYVPTGYHLEGVDVKNLVNVTLPAWMSAGNLYFLDAPSIGVTFIAMGYKMPAAPAYRHHDDDDDEPVEVIEWPEPNGDLELCRRYSEDPVIEKYGVETLTFLIELVKNTVQPQAVNALRDAMPSFKKAEDDGELGEEVSVQFVDNGSEGPAAAFSYTHNDEGEMVYRMDINVDAFSVLDDTTGKYVFDESTRSRLDSVVTGEMLHAFMVDYTRNGMYGQLPDGALSDENAFPEWFMHGMATLVEDNYALRYDEFAALADSGEYGDLVYSAESLAENAQSLEDSHYGSGYLAALYLSALAAHDITEFENEQLREGMNSLLERLHGGESLDAIIRDIAPLDDDGEPIYDGLEDFTQKFLNDDHSTEFCSTYLNLLEDASEDEPAPGNILRDMGEPAQPAEGEVENPGAYQLTDNKEFAVSTVDEAESLKTGGALYGYDPETGEIIEPEGDAPDEEEDEEEDEDETVDESGDETGDETEDETGDETEDETEDESGDETEDETGDETEEESGDETEDESGDETEQAPAAESEDTPSESQDTGAQSAETQEQEARTDDNQNQEIQKDEPASNALMEQSLATPDASASDEERIAYAIMASYSASDDAQEEDGGAQEDFDADQEDDYE